MSEHVVFISYSSKDVVIAKQVLEYLEKNGIPCWMAPRNIVPGRHYASSILDAIKSSKAFFLLFSPYSNISEQCLKEVDRAVNAKLPIIPFRIVEHPPTEAMEYYLCNTHWLDAFNKQTGEYFPQLLSTCRRILEGNTPEIVTPSRPQKNIDDISEGMQEMLKKVDYSVASDEEDRKNFYKKHTSVDKTKPSMLNPLIEPTQQNFKIDEFLKENNKDLSSNETSKKKRKRVRLKSSKEFSKNKKTGSKNKLLIPFFFILFGSFAIYTFNMMEDRNKAFKANSKTSMKKKIKKIEKVRVEVDYEYLSQNILTFDDLSFLEKETIADYRTLINSKEGNLFERVGGSLVEKRHNRFEINNLAALDTLEHRSKYEILKQFQNSNLDLKAKYPLVYFIPDHTSDDRVVEGSWDFHQNTMKHLLRDHTIQTLSTRDYPDQDDFSREFHFFKVTLFVTPRIILDKKYYIEFQYQAYKNNELVKNILTKYKSQFKKLKLSIKIKEAEKNSNQTIKKTSFINVNMSLGENMTETLENKDYKMVKIILGEVISEISTQIRALK